MSTWNDRQRRKNADADVYDDETLENVHVLMMPIPLKGGRTTRIHRSVVNPLMIAKWLVHALPKTVDDMHVTKIINQIIFHYTAGQCLMVEILSLPLYNLRADFRVINYNFYGV